MYIFLNDKIVPESEGVVSVYDHGFLYGDGVYETMRAYEGVVFKFERHLERLARSAALISLALPDLQFIANAVTSTLAANNLADAYIRITVSRGKGPVGLDPQLCKAPTFVVIAEKFKHYPETLYSEGAKLIIADTRRNFSGALNPKVKSLNFLNNILAKIEAKDKDAFEAVMLNHEGFIAEGTVSNIFFVRHGTLCTPSADVGILDGITRETVISLALKNGVPVEEGKYYPAELFEASEVFFTNTTAEVMPVSRINDVEYRIGKITKFLHKLYREEVSGDGKVKAAE